MARKSKEAQTRLIQKYIDKGKASGKRDALKKVISSNNVLGSCIVYFFYNVFPFIIIIITILYLIGIAH